MQWIPSPNWESRNGAAVRLVVVHTAETTADAVGLANYFSTTAAQTSAHVCVDDTQMVQCVDYGNAAWTVRSANHVSDNIEQCAFAAWTADDWAQHPNMLEQTAQWVADRCAARGIPIVKLGPDEVAAGQSGVIGHVDWTLGMHDGTHTDPGDNYPWGQVIARAQEIAGGGAGGGGASGPSPDDVAAAFLGSAVELFGDLSDGTTGDLGRAVPVGAVLGWLDNEHDTTRAAVADLVSAVGDSVDSLGVAPAAKKEVP